ncbi:MAG TPA: DNA methyltransferase [Pilimelia sp.]|nr:DNA methyltransferase [Pilimelia sp.]
MLHDGSHEALAASQDRRPGRPAAGRGRPRCPLPGVPLAATVIQEYTTRGERVLDPFAGYGTTLIVAELMERHAIGVERLPERAELIRSRLRGDAEVINGDARNLTALVPGPVDLCFTSPPYMTVADHPANPLNAYQTLNGDYATYLTGISNISSKWRSFCAPADMPSSTSPTSEQAIRLRRWLGISPAPSRNTSHSGRSHFCAGTNSPME